MHFQTPRCSTTDRTGTRYKSAVATVRVRRLLPAVRSRLMAEEEARKVAAAAATGSRQRSAGSEMAAGGTLRATSTRSAACRAVRDETNDPRVSVNVAELSTAEPVCRRNHPQRATSLGTYVHDFVNSSN